MNRPCSELQLKLSCGCSSYSNVGRASQKLYAIADRAMCIHPGRSIGDPWLVHQQQLLRTTGPTALTDDSQTLKHTVPIIDTTS
jgi:hypothetical protein